MKQPATDPPDPGMANPDTSDLDIAATHHNSPHQGAAMLAPPGRRQCARVAGGCYAAGQWWYHMSLTGQIRRMIAVAVRLSGRVVMQRPAKPCTSVRLRAQPPLHRPLQRRGLPDFFLDFHWRNLTIGQRPGGGIGRRKGLKIPRWRHRAGSNPAPGTIPRPATACARHATVRDGRRFRHER